LAKVTICTVVTRVEALEQEVENLTPEELTAFSDWFAEFDWQAWDRELEKDVAGGRLDRFADEVLEEHRIGKTTDLRTKD
jgi:hypothetical protein